MSMKSGYLVESVELLEVPKLSKSMTTELVMEIDDENREFQQKDRWN